MSAYQNKTLLSREIQLAPDTTLVMSIRESGDCRFYGEHMIVVSSSLELNQEHIDVNTLTVRSFAVTYAFELAAEFSGLKIEQLEVREDDVRFMAVCVRPREGVVFKGDKL